MSEANKNILTCRRENVPITYLKLLKEYDFKINELTFIDMFTHAMHIECVMLVSKAISENIENSRDQYKIAITKDNSKYEVER